MTKRLDETYYAVLEKMSSLQDTVTAMKELAEASRDTCDGFDRDSHRLEDDIDGQLAAIGRFDEQRASIDGLQKRIRDGRARIQTLTGRVDVVRERIEKWERADRAWQEKTRKRLKIFWSATSVVAILVIALAVSIGHSPGASDAVDQADGREATALQSPGPPSSSRPLAGEGGGAPPWKSRPNGGERLRGLDEL